MATKAQSPSIRTSRSIRRFWSREKGISHRLRMDRCAWAQVARRSVQMLGESLQQGDAAALSSEELVEVRAAAASDMVLFVYVVEQFRTANTLR